MKIPKSIVGFKSSKYEYGELFKVIMYYILYYIMYVRFKNNMT